jgi:hypothetical protein
VGGVRRSAPASGVLLNQPNLRASESDHPRQRALGSTAIIVGARTAERAAIRHHRHDIALSVKVVVVLVVGHRSGIDGSARLGIVNVPNQVEQPLLSIILRTVSR